MKSKLFLVGAIPCVLACSAWWIGCGGTSTSTADTTDGGNGEGGNGEGGTITEAGTDSAAVDASITGPFIDIQYKGCTPLAACGGDPKGLWRLTGGCVGEGAFAAAKQQCAGLTETNVKFQARGTVFADATTIARKTEVKYTATLAVPKTCKDANPLGTTCKDLEAGIKFTGIASATCADAAAGGGCDCDVADSKKEDTSDTYTTSGNTLTSGAQTFDYCVAGSEIKYEETTANAIPAVFTLTK